MPLILPVTFEGFTLWAGSVGPTKSRGSTTGMSGGDRSPQLVGPQDLKEGKPPAPLFCHCCDSREPTRAASENCKKHILQMQPRKLF